MMASRLPRPRRLPRLAAIGLAALLLAPGIAAGASGGSVRGRVFASPLFVTLSLSPGSAQVGQPIKAEATVSNLGKQAISSIRLELRADRAGLAIRDAIAEVNNLKAGKSATVTWSVCGRTVGSYVLLVRATAGGVSIDSPARVLAIVAGGKKSCA
jgi:CARDB protein